MVLRRKVTFQILFFMLLVTTWASAQSAVDHFKLGDAAFDAEKCDLAITEYTKEIEIHPNNTAAYFNRGLAYYNKRSYDAAITDLSKTIRFDPTNAGAFYRRGHAHYLKIGGPWGEKK